MDNKNIHQYRMGIVGNCSFLAYVAADTGIEWMCMPRFDSAPIFGSMLGGKLGGEFSMTAILSSIQLWSSFGSSFTGNQ